ncbi:chemotaxis protein CheA [Carboxydothermus hydrogenoformans]|uniref:Chemotaxis protein CheA n=1 Tax=Carboxydothermus hydrogenoformans (strain ATCC BAA-161 / DSM 6008 / Z-2901) TaxID=246194 RepID=Q3ADH0_CARHZ|nr:chemotaxis protein CheA [Carboxydothermus hydrogenoformans]ABB13824.1 chemotaxis protein CheA [Carboxydothermus hydrogenoformans Z-2901]
MFSDVEMAVFLDELEEKIQVLTDNLLLLEQSGEDDPKVLQEIFRAAHTIKGSSAVMGFTKMSSLTHEIENIFDKMRNNELKPTSSLINVLFEALDALKILRDEIVAENAENYDTTEIIAKLKEAVAGTGAKSSETQAPKGETAEFSGDEIEKIREFELKGYQLSEIKVYLDPAAVMKSVRAFIVLQQLKELGTVIKTVPAEEILVKTEDFNDFIVYLATNEDEDRLQNILLTIPEVERVEISAKQLEDNIEARNEEQKVEKTDVQDIVSEKTATVEKPAAEVKTKTSAVAPAEEKKVTQTVRVDVQKLDTLMNLVGELVIDRTRLLSVIDKLYTLSRENNELVETLAEISSHVGQITTDLQDVIMKARMLPIAQVFNRFPRMVRDLAQKLNKEVEFIIEGKETELDRNVIEVIGDPLIHLIRNALDHGIEPPEEREKLGKPRAGRLRLAAAYLENNIVITVEDDGRGIDPDAVRKKAVEKGLISEREAEMLSDKEAIKLIFRSGLSTAQKVNDISGRGVGMDIVKSQIEQINGEVQVESQVGKGTTFTIRLPLTLAIIRALLVEHQGQIYAFPLNFVQETLIVGQEELRKVSDYDVMLLRGKVLPLISLSKLFNLPEDQEQKQWYFVVILGTGNHRLGVIVDNLLGEQEIVIKSLGEYLGQVKGLSGATILGDGRIGLIIDARGILQENEIGELNVAV